MAPRKNDKKKPVGVLAPKPKKKKWQNPITDRYVGADAPVFGGGDGGLTQTFRDTVASKQDGYGQAILDRLFMGNPSAATFPGGLRGPNMSAGAAQPPAGGGVASGGLAEGQLTNTALDASGSESILGLAPGATDQQRYDFYYQMANGGGPLAAYYQKLLNGSGGATAVGRGGGRGGVGSGPDGAFQRQMALLASVLAQAQQTGTQAADAAAAAINANPSPYQNIQLQHMADQSNPLAAYMRALGTSSGQADATMGLINSMNQTQNAGLEQLSGNLNTINQNARQSSLNDIERSKQSMIQQLAMQRASEEMAIKNYYSSRGVRV